MIDEAIYDQLKKLTERCKHINSSMMLIQEEIMGLRNIFFVKDKKVELDFPIDTDFGVYKEKISILKFKDKKYTTRINNALFFEKIYFIGDLVTMTDYELRLIPNVGEKAFNEIIESLNEKQLSLNTTFNQWPQIREFLISKLTQKEKKALRII